VRVESVGFCKLIVAVNVSPKDRQAMEDLHEHRQMLRQELQDSNGIDVSSSMRLLESDLNEIEAGLARLQQPTLIRPAIPPGYAQPD
jgi:hypothetical protein